MNHLVENRSIDPRPMRIVAAVAAAKPLKDSYPVTLLEIKSPLSFSQILFTSANTLKGRRWCSLTSMVTSQVARKSSRPKSSRPM